MEETNTTVTETNKAENNGGDPKGGADNSVNAVSTPDPARAEKTFTQKELDEIVKQRLERAAKGQPSKEELKAFREWQDSQKTAEQLSNEKISAVESEKAAAEKRAEAAEAKCAAFSKGVTAEAVDDVIALALARVSESTDIGTAIDEVVKKYPHFCGNTAPKGVTTGFDFSRGKTNETDGVTAAFLSRNPGIKL